MLAPQDRVILISGASRGIGAAIAKNLLDKGYRLSLGLRDPARIPDALKGADPSRIHTARYDARDWSSHEKWIADAAARYGRIDGLINNAGQHSPATLRDATEEQLDEIYAVNCKAPLNMIRHCLPFLEESGAGRVINVASMSGKRVRNDQVAYNMSKFAVMALTHATRRIGWEKGVRATALCPSFVRTDMVAGTTKVTMAEMTDPNDLAEIASMLLALPNNAVVAEMLVNCRLEDMV